MEPKIILMDTAQYEFLLLERGKRQKRGRKKPSSLSERPKT